MQSDHRKQTTKSTPFAGTGTALIHVRDINDMPPRFSKAVWNTTVDETDGDDLPDKAILTVTVLDEDETNKFHYKVGGESRNFYCKGCGWGRLFLLHGVGRVHKVDL